MDKKEAIVVGATAGLIIGGMIGYQFRFTKYQRAALKVTEAIQTRAKLLAELVDWMVDNRENLFDGPAAPELMERIQFIQLANLEVEG